MPLAFTCPKTRGRVRSRAIARTIREEANRFACKADSIDSSAAATTSQNPSDPRKFWALTATMVAGAAAATSVTLPPAGTPTVATTNRSGRYTTIATASDSSMARGMVRPGDLISPPAAAIRSNPWKAMKVKPMAAKMPPRPLGANGTSFPARFSLGAPTKMARPTAMSAAKITTLPIVAQLPPPPALRLRVTV